MTAPRLWVVAWELISCACERLAMAGLTCPERKEVSSGGLDSTCPDGIYADVGAGDFDLVSGTLPRLVQQVDLIVVRSCVPRGIDPAAGARLAAPGQPPDGFDPCSWVPTPNTFAAGQEAVLADLDALLPAMVTPLLRGCDGSPDGPTVRASRVTPYRTGDQGRYQGWHITYRVTVP